MPKTRPPHDRDLVQRAHRMRDEGQPVARIAKALGVHRETVKNWFDNPDLFDPYLDEVAVRRALAGDIKVYDNLTRFELDEVNALLAEEWRALPPGNQFQNPDILMWARFGADRMRVRKCNERYRDRARRAAA